MAITLLRMGVTLVLLKIFGQVPILIMLLARWVKKGVIMGAMAFTILLFKPKTSSANDFFRDIITRTTSGSVAGNTQKLAWFLTLWAPRSPSAETSLVVNDLTVFSTILIKCRLKTLAVSAVGRSFLVQFLKEFINFQANLLIFGGFSK